MSIALDNNPNSSGFLRRNNKLSPFNLSPIGDRTVMRESGYLDPCSSSSSSSIGVNSDVEDDDEHKDDGEHEVQSKLKNTSFDSAVDALEQALPIRRGISNFYNGKSKSFASLTDAASSSIKEITKSENAYSRKRKNLLAYDLLYDKGRASWLKSPGIGGGIAKRPTNSSRSTLALAVAMKNCEPQLNEDGSVPESNEKNNGRSPSTSPPSLPPPWRSFSLVDLQQCAVSASVVRNVRSNLSSPLMGKRTKTDEIS